MDMANTNAFMDVNIRQPDELSFVDDDVRELFEGCSYIMGMPLMAQLIKELRLLRDSLLETSQN